MARNRTLRLTARQTAGQNADMLCLNASASAPVIVRRLPVCMWLRMRARRPESG